MASTASRTPARKSTAQSRSGSPSKRAHMIAEAAYYIAEQRGFAGGDPVQDWLDAEAQIDRTPAGTRRKTRAR